MPFTVTDFGDLVRLMVKRVDSLGQSIGDLKGIGLEFRYQRLAYADFQRLL